MATIGVSERNYEVVETLYDTGYFKDKANVALFAFAYAMRNHLDVKYPDYHAQKAETKWGYEDLDKEGIMYALVASLYPDADNVENKVQEIINLGLMKIGEKIAGKTDISITSLMEIQEVE